MIIKNNSVGWITLTLLNISTIFGAADEIIRADLPITKVDHIISNIYCISNPKAKEFKAHERLVKDIDMNAFTNCTKLVSINLDSNRMKCIRTGIFGTNLNKLELLNLGNNQLSYLHREIFLNLTGLKVLQLWDNILNAIHKDTFKHNIKLEKLQLYGNHLEYIHPDTFANLINLKVLHLDNNKLKTLQPKLVENLANLEEFFFCSNELPYICQTEILRALPMLKEVNFNNNDFSCAEVDRIIKRFRTKVDLHISSFVESNPRRPDATNTTQGEFYCITEEEWQKKSIIYRQRADRAEIIYQLQVNMDEQRDVIDEMKMSLYTMQASFIGDTTYLKVALNNAMKEVADLKLQVSHLKLTNLEMMNAKVKLEEEYHDLMQHTHEKVSINGFAGMVNLTCKMETYPVHDH